MKPSTKYSLLLDTYQRSGTHYVVARVITLENNKPRNLSGNYLFDIPKTQYYSNLTLKAHYATDYNDLGLVMHGIEYTDVLSIDQNKAEAMAKTLKRISLKIQKLDETRIYSGSKTYAQTVLDFAAAINAEFIVFYKSDHHNSNYDSNDYRLYKPSESHWAIQKLMDSLIVEKVA